MEEKEVKKTTRKATTKKKTATKKVDKEINIEDISPELIAKILAMANTTQEKIENKKEEIRTFTKAQLFKIKDEEVMVESVGDGLCNFISPRTHMEYKWIDKGEILPMTIDEIIAMDNYSKRFLHTPWVKPLDDRVISGLGLGDIFESIDKLKDIDELVKLDFEEIKEILNKANKEFKNELAGELYNKVINKELRDIVVIENFEKLLGKNLRD